LGSEGEPIRSRGRSTVHKRGLEESLYINGIEGARIPIRKNGPI